VSGLFPVPSPPDALGPCAWCSEPATERVEVEPAVFSAAGGVRVMKKRAIEADVCPAHAAMVARNRDERERKRDRKFFSR
jgi:hypothetical protein